MTFLNPAVLFGLIAASIPILIHLLNLRKLKKIEFSSLIFLKELQKNKIRKIKVKQWLLLVIRTLILIFLVMAFARPALKGISLGGITSSAKTSAVIIIDDTYSMSVIKSDGSLFNKAKLHISEILSQLQEGDEVAVIKMSGFPQDEEINFSKDLSSAKDKIRALEISSVSGDLHSAIVKAEKLLSGSHNYNKEIYIISDFQKQRLTEEKALPDLSGGLSEKVRIYAIQPEKSVPVNAAVELVKILSGVFEKNKPVEVEGVIKNHSESPVENLTASLFINGERVSQKSISLQPGESQKVVFQGLLKKSGHQDIFIEIDEDMITEDNRRFESIFLPEKIKLLLLFDDAANVPFLKLALNIANPGGIFIIEEASTSKASSYDFRKYNAIIVIGSKGLNTRTELEQYVSGGGNLMFFPGRNESPENVKTLFSAIAPLRDAGNVTSTSAEFGTVDLLHPVLAGLFVSKEKSKIESPVINTYLKISSSSGYPVIRLNDGSFFLSEYKYGKGHALLFSVTPVPEASDLPYKSIFAPLIYKSVLFLSSSEREEQIIAGSPLILNNISTKYISLARANQPEEKITINSESGQISYSYTATNVLSNYFFKNASGIFRAVPVNCDTRESVPEYLTGQEIKDYLAKINFKGNLYEIGWNDNISAALGSLRFGTELWKYFVLLALILLIAEMLIARANKKDLEHFKNS